LSFATFENKKAAEAHFSAMLSRYDVGDFVSDPDTSELTSLLLRHHDAETKIGCGIGGFVVIGNQYGGRCFAVVRTDGSVADFSLFKCVSGVPKSSFQDVLKACRRSVDGFMLQVRTEIFGIM
jgi:hypothetical protein